MSTWPKVVKGSALFGAFGLSALLALRLHGGGLWHGLAPASAASSTHTAQTYDLTQLKVVNEVLKTVRDRYVDPKRAKPKDMLLSALNYVQKDVAQVIVIYEEGAPTVKVRVDTQEKEFRVDNVQGPWDVSSHLRDIFAFVQEGLRGTEVDLREVEYAACNGMLHTLDPHSTLLSPEAYKEMNLSTSGQFGGLGIVISIRDQQLTVMNPMPGTPAGRAGVKRMDRIVKIGNESTLNMGLNEAVQHLRGAPGSKVSVWLHRDGPDGWAGAKEFVLSRETIKVASVESHALDGGIGYVRLKQFQANTAADLDKALAELKKGGELKGLVLDLRGNPGGLLDQAARVVDKFIVQGPIVATVGNASEDREEKVAHADGTEPNYPIAILVSGSSASASEIVAGAMKNHDRAVLIGETTFGKGSVQLVFPDLPDKAALKLTIAQYLTEPGDISIQGTGITPDIELDPMTADLQEMDLTVDQGGTKERDLARSLSSSRTREGQKPSEVLRYNLPQKERQELRERGGDPDDAFALDFPIRFARDAVAKMPVGKRPEQVRAVKALVTEARNAEIVRVGQDLQGLGIDWTDSPAPPLVGTAMPAEKPSVDVKIETDRPNNEGTPGEPLNLKLTVTNKGKEPLFRLAAMTKSDNPMFDNKELVVGKLEPGKSRTVTAPLGWCETEGKKIGSSAPLPKDAPRVCRIPRDARVAQRRHHREVRRSARPRPRQHRGPRRRKSARSARVRLQLPGRRQQKRQRRRPRPEGRGRHHVRHRHERRQRSRVRGAGEPPQPVRRRRPPPRGALRRVELEAGRVQKDGLLVRGPSGAGRSRSEGGALRHRSRSARDDRGEGAHPGRPPRYRHRRAGLGEGQGAGRAPPRVAGFRRAHRGQAPSRDGRASYRNHGRF